MLDLKGTMTRNPSLQKAMEVKTPVIVMPPEVNLVIHIHDLNRFILPLKEDCNNWTGKMRNGCEDEELNMDCNFQKGEVIQK